MGGKKTKPISNELTATQVALLRANTNFTDSEIRQWHEGFLRDCPNGRLDKKKFLEIHQQFFPHGNAEHYCKYAFDTFDSNKDGTIDFNEFLLSIAATQKGNINDRLSVAFDLYDVSNDDQIDRNELVRMFTALYDLAGVTDRSGFRDPTTRADEVIKLLDITGEKKLNKEEFIVGCKDDPVVREILVPHL